MSMCKMFLSTGSKVNLKYHSFIGRQEMLKLTWMQNGNIHRAIIAFH